MVRSPGATRIAEDKDRLPAIHELVGLGLVRPRRAGLETLLAVALVYEPLAAPGHLGDLLRSIVLDDPVQRWLDRRHGAQMLDHLAAAGDRSLVVDWTAFFVEHRCRALGAGIIDEYLHLLRGEGALKVLDHRVERAEIEVEIGALFWGEAVETAIEGAFGGRNQLDDNHLVAIQMEIDGSNQRGELHRQQQLVEEALLGAFKPASRGSFRTAVERCAIDFVDHAGQLQRLLKVLMDDRPGVGISVVNGDLFGCQIMFQDVVFDACEAECARLIEAKCLEIARHEFHRSDAPCPDLADEIFPVGKRGARSPQTKPHGIGKVVDLRGSGRRGVENPGIGQIVLQQHAGDALQRSAFRAAGALAPCNTAHLVALIEGDDTVEILARPIEQLLQAGGVLTLTAKGRVGDEQDPFAKRNRLIDLPVGKWLNVGR